MFSLSLFALSAPSLIAIQRTSRSTKKEFRIVSDFQIVAPQGRHILAYNCSHVSGLISAIIRLKSGLSKVTPETPLLMKNMGLEKTVLAS